MKSSLTAVRTNRSSSDDRFEQVEAVDAALHLRRVAAVAFQRAVDRADRAAEAGVVDDATVRWLSSRAALSHPVPQRCSPGDRRILLHQVRVGPEVKPERHAGAAIVEIPAQLDRTAAVVALARRANAARRGTVRTVEATSDFSDVNQAAGFVREIRERRGGFASAHGQVTNSRKFREGRGRIHKSLVGVERIAIREHLVELRLTHNCHKPTARIRIRTRRDARADGTPRAISAGVSLRILVLVPPLGFVYEAVHTRAHAARIDRGCAPGWNTVAARAWIRRGSRRRRGPWCRRRRGRWWRRSGSGRRPTCT